MPELDAVPEPNRDARAATDVDDPALDLRRAEPWLRRALPGAGPLRALPLAGGHSNLMVRLTDGEGNWVVRRPPANKVDRRAHDLARELRVLRALEGTGVPIPSAIAYCDDLDVIGCPFLITEWVDGFPGRPPLPAPFQRDTGLVRVLALALVDVLAVLGDVDWKSVGLDGYGRPDGFHQRQVGRWTRQLESYQVREIPLLPDVATWLGANAPATFEPGVMHGDYGPRNVLFAPAPPARVAAVVDWEQSTIGDPLLDLGWMTALWERQCDDLAGRGDGPRFAELDGMPTRAELVDRYASRSRRDVGELAYYQVLALFKLACVLEGAWAKHLRGQSSDPYHTTLESRVPGLVRRAATIAGSGRPW